MISYLQSVEGSGKKKCQKIRTSPAPPARPDRHLAASRLAKLSAFAVQMRTAKCIAIDVMSAKRLPNLTPNGTQTRLPTPRKSKLNYSLVNICSA